MHSFDLTLYLVHAAFWASFGIAHIITSSRSRPDEPGISTAPAAVTEVTAAGSRMFVALHAVAFAVLYFGMGSAIFSHRVPNWFPGQRIVGALVIAGGAALVSWARIWFHSWRFRARLDVGHQLATGGPFRWMRHPIYMGLNLLALGTALWIPTPAVWAGVVLMSIGSDLRGRAEEQVLTVAFGERYVEYSKRTRRFVPGIY